MNYKELLADKLLNELILENLIEKGSIDIEESNALRKITKAITESVTENIENEVLQYISENYNFNQSIQNIQNTQTNSSTKLLNSIL